MSGTHIGEYYTGDERNIWDAAVRLYLFSLYIHQRFIWFVSFILPVVMAPSIIKIVFSSLVLGYAIHRVKKLYKTDLALALYGLYLIKPSGIWCSGRSG